jgi:hypothetical protein
MCNNSTDLLKERTVKTYINLTKPDPDPVPHSSKSIVKLLELWGLSYFPNKMRDFLFKFFNNTLGVNARIGNYNPNINQSCTFCLLKGVLPAQRETFVHVFYDCPAVQDARRKFFEIFFKDMNLDSDLKERQLLFFGVCPVKQDNTCLFLRSLIFTWHYVIWEAKLSKRLLSSHIAMHNLTFLLKNMLMYSGRLRYAKTNSCLLLCRNWDNYVSGEA